MRLSPNFTITELTKSAQAERLGLDNTPSPAVIDNLARVCGQILEPVRAHYGIPFAPSSGYRCEKLEKVLCWNGDNEKSAFALWCKKRNYPVIEKHWPEYFEKKQHPSGESTDFEVPGVPNYELACWIRDNLGFDQLILEYYTPGIPDSGWIHASIKATGNRKEVLTINKSGKYHGLIA